ncbi:hypothetical protein LUZ60_010618 [Juncus effusus]|nr:hypothetical protein LUZ60_010618 [Juncus effusus]
MQALTFTFSLLLLLFLHYPITSPEAIITPNTYSSEQQPLNPGELSSTTVPALPVAQLKNATCHLDLSAELFGGVSAACGGPGLDRSRCCPVLAAWLFAAHARSALEISSPSDDVASYGEDGPMVPYDNQKCVDALQEALDKKGVELPKPNSTCDTVICFCGIRLHQIGSLRCPAAFSVPDIASGGGGGGRPAVKAAVAGGQRNATPTAAVRDLEKNCRNASFAGCTKCMQSLQKLKGNSTGQNNNRESKMMGRDCQLMGLTWLLALNKSAYIPTVSAVLRALLYTKQVSHLQSSCSPDRANMPLAVDSLQFQRLGGESSGADTWRDLSGWVRWVCCLLFGVVLVVV